MRASPLPRLLLTASLLMFGCGPSPECRAEVDAFQTMLESLPREGRGLWQRAETETIVVLDDAIPADDVDVVAREPLFLYATQIGVASSEGSVSTQSVPDAAAEIGALLAKHWGEPRIVLVAQQDAAWEHVAVVLEAVRERGLGSIDLLFRRSAAIPPAPEPSRSMFLDPEMPPDQRRSTVATKLESLANECRPLVDVLVEIGPLPEVEFSERARSEFRKPLLDCNCDADPRALGAILHYLIAPPFVPAVVTISLASDPTLETLKFPPNATWADVHRQVVDTRARPVRFAVGSEG